MPSEDLSVSRRDGEKISLFRHRNAAVVKNIVIYNFIHGTMGKEKIHMLFQHFAMRKTIDERVHELLFFFRECIGICPIYRREKAVL